MDKNKKTRNSDLYQDLFTLGTEGLRVLIEEMIKDMRKEGYKQMMEKMQGDDLDKENFLCNLEVVHEVMSSDTIDSYVYWNILRHLDELSGNPDKSLEVSQVIKEKMEKLDGVKRGKDDEREIINIVSPAKKCQEVI